MSDALSIAAAELTADQRRAVDAILSDEEMRVSAGAAAVGTSVAVVSRWMRQEAVRRYLGAALADRRERHADIRDKTVQALYQLATYDIADAIDTEPPEIEGLDDPDLHAMLSALCAGGRLKPPHELPDQLRAAVRKVKHTRWGWEYEFADRTAILLALLKHFGDIDKYGALTPGGDDDKVIIEYFNDED